MEMVQVQIADGFPVALQCLSDGTVMLSPMYRFPVIVEDTPSGVSSVFTAEGFRLREEGQTEYIDYEYAFPYGYKKMPALKAWLVQQQLISPFASKEAEEEQHET